MSRVIAMKAPSRRFGLDAGKGLALYPLSATAFRARLRIEEPYV